MKVFCTTNDALVRAMFFRKGWDVVDSISQKHDLLCFTGGADVSPFLYGERPIKGTNFCTRRDNFEIQTWRWAKRNLGKDFPKVGICRGAQFGNVMLGGSLWQNVDNHMTSHLIKDNYFEGAVKQVGHLQASSDHHQMVRLTDDAMLLATACRAIRKEAETELQVYGYMQSKNDWEDPEAFFYADSNFLGVQFHPEYPNVAACERYFWDLTYDINNFKDLSHVQTDKRAF